MPENMTPYNQFYGQRIRSGAAGVSVARSQIARYLITDVAAASTTNAMAAVNLGAQVQSVITGFTAPDYPRNVVIDGNVSGITGNVKVYGTDFEGEAINETLALNGTNDVPGALAFKTVTKVDLPVQVHTPAAQTETIEVTGGCSSAGDIAVAVTATTLLGDGSGESVTVTLTTDDNTVTEVAAKVVAELNTNEIISAVFTATNAEGVITLAAKTPLANDASLSIAFTVGSTGVTVGSSTNGTAGVAYDKVSVGYGVKIGIPFKLTADEKVIVKLFDNSADSGTVTASATVLSANVITLNGNPNGAKDVELYILTP